MTNATTEQELNVNEAEFKQEPKIILTPADQEDTIKHGFKLTLGTKIELIKEAGRRQANGETGGEKDLGFPVSRVVMEALAQELNVVLQEPNNPQMDKNLNDEMQVIMSMPKLLKEALLLRAESTKTPMNHIVNHAINKSIGLIPQEELANMLAKKTTTQPVEIPTSTKINKIVEQATDVENAVQSATNEVPRRRNII